MSVQFSSVASLCACFKSLTCAMKWRSVKNTKLEDDVGLLTISYC